MTPEEGHAEALRRIAEARQTRATELDLSGLNLSVIPPEIRGLDYLQSLELRNNKISRIENLPDGLQSLNLSYNQISRIENLPDALQSLELQENQISRIENLPDGLQSLELNDNQISRIENLPEGLQSLDLSYNQISRIENLPDGLQSLKLSGNPTINVPPELLGDWDYNCLPDVRAWFADLAEGSVRNITVRLMLTGNGNVGKSSLVTALQQDSCAEDLPSTHGIRIDTITLHDATRKPVTMQVFDFGGQELYHGTHALFLRGRAVQLLVFDAETEALAVTPDRITKEEVRNQKLPYWANQIKRLSPDSPVVLAQNKTDKPATLSPDTQATINELETAGASFIKVSAKKGKGISGLRGHLLEAAQQLPEFRMQMPQSWHRVRQFFLDNLQRPATTRQRLMLMRTFMTLCRKHKVLPNSEAALLRYLHHTGAVYADAEFLADTIIADQQWAIEAIYKALDRAGELYALLRELSFGKCQVRQILRAFGPDYTAEQSRLFLNLMQSCGLCFPLKTEDYQEDSPTTYYIFPEFLLADRPEAVEYFLEKPLRVWQQQAAFLPYSHIQQQIVKWNAKADIQDIWRTGLRFKTDTGAFVLEADLATNTLSLHADSSLSDTGLAELLSEFSYEQLTWTEQGTGKPVAVRTEERDSQLLSKLPDVDQPSPQRLVASYAREDDRYVDLLRKKLSTRSTVVFWYDRNLSSRDAWEPALTEEFEQAHGFVIFLSDDYTDIECKTFIWENELPIIKKRFLKPKNNDTPVIIIRVANASTVGIDLLKPYLQFNKGAIMPCPEKNKDEASAYLQHFVDDWVLKEFLKTSQ